MALADLMSMVSRRTVLWELDRQTFGSVAKDAAAKKRTAYKEFLKKVPLFINIDSYEIMTVADALKVKLFPEEGTQLIRQGAVRVHKVGDILGEVSLIKNQLQAASVYTSAPDTKFLTMGLKTFERLMGAIVDILHREARRYERPAPSCSYQWREGVLGQWVRAVNHWAKV